MKRSDDNDEESMPAYFESAVPPVVQQGNDECTGDQDCNHSCDAAYQRGKQEGVEAEREANAKRLEELEARWRKHVQGIFNNEESDPIGDELVYADVKKACARELKQLAAAIRSNSQGQGEKK